MRETVDHGDANIHVVVMLRSSSLVRRLRLTEYESSPTAA